MKLVIHQLPLPMRHILGSPIRNEPPNMVIFRTEKDVQVLLLFKLLLY